MEVFNENKQYSHNWKNTEKENPILPDLYKDSGANTLSGLQNKVLFIGSNDSMHSSICWELQVSRDQSQSKQIKERQYSAILVAPEGGRLLDVTDWDQGFKQIYSRHRYEQLYESVVVNRDTKDSVDSLSFEIPEKSTMNRILGIESTSNAMNVPNPPPYPKECDPLENPDWPIQFDPTEPNLLGIGLVWFRHLQQCIFKIQLYCFTEI